MKRLIIIIIIFFMFVLSIIPFELIPPEISEDNYKKEILDKVYMIKDKEFVNSCYEFDVYKRVYKLKENLEDYKISKLKKIFESMEDFKIDWIDGRIYSSAYVYAKNDYNFANNRLEGINIAYEKAKINFYKALKRINIYESLSVLNYFEERPDKNRELFTLIDKATLYRVEYPDVNTIKLTYYIDIFGDNSLMSIMMSERDIYTEDLTSFMGYNFETNYTGIIIDARGVLTSFDGYSVKVRPSMFIVVKDMEGRTVFDKNNVYPDIIRKKGMVRYSYNINEDQTERVGNKPLKIVACGTGDRSGSHIVITELDAKRMLSSEKTREAIKSGNIVIIIDP